MLWWIDDFYWTLFSPELDALERELLADQPLDLWDYECLREQIWAMAQGFA